MIVLYTLKDRRNENLQEKEIDFISQKKKKHDKILISNQSKIGNYSGIVFSHKWCETNFQNLVLGESVGLQQK